MSGFNPVAYFEREKKERERTVRLAGAPVLGVSVAIKASGVENMPSYQPATVTIPSSPKFINIHV